MHRGSEGCVSGGTSAEAVLMGGGGAVRLEGLKKAATKGAEQPYEPSQALVHTRALLHAPTAPVESSSTCAQPLALRSGCLLCLPRFAPLSAKGYAKQGGTCAG